MNVAEILLVVGTWTLAIVSIALAYVTFHAIPPEQRQSMIFIRVDSNGNEKVEEID